MTSEVNDFLENTNTEELQILKSVVDYYIVKFDQKYDFEERNELIMNIYRLLEKKVLANPNAKFDSDKVSYIGIIAKSYITVKIAKDKKSLDNSN